MSDLPPDFELTACPGCGSDRFTRVREARDMNRQTQLRFTIVRCDACGLHYTNPRPTLATLGRWYPEDYEPYQQEKSVSDLSGGAIGRLLQRNAFGAPSVRPAAGARAVAGVFATVRAPESFGFAVAYRGRGRLLDYGCGGGKFLRRMRALGWDVTGVDFSATAVEAVRASGIRAMQGMLPHPDLAPQSFDVVTLRHVLEHTPNPTEILREAWKLLDGGGLLVIQVPNYASWEVKRFGDAATQLDLPRHLLHFTPATLQAMLDRLDIRPATVRQSTHSSWIRKAAARATRDGNKSILRHSPVARLAAIYSRFTNQGNELIATAEKG